MEAITGRDMETSSLFTGITPILFSGGAAASVFSVGIGRSPCIFGGAKQAAPCARFFQHAHISTAARACQCAPRGRWIDFQRGLC
jgi:hypothetical protein